MISADDFFRAILEDPDGDEPRLVFADWLEEHGNPRSEFIRLQCELAALPEDHPERSEREARSRLLLSMHEAEWVGGLRAFVQRWKFHRGFVDWVHVPARMFLAHAEDIFRLAPIRKLSLGDVNPHLEDLAACPHLERVTSLQINPEFSWRQNDYPSSQLTDGGALTLARSPYVTNLRRLDLGWNQLTGWGVKNLTSSPHLKKLKAIDLSDNNLDDGAMVALSGPHGWRLTTLALSNNHIGDSGVAVFQLVGEVFRRNWSELSELHLASNQMSRVGVRHLACSGFTNLRTVSLDGNDIDGQAIEDFAQSSVSARLARLSLSSNRIGDLGARHLAAAPFARNLTHLYLRYNGIGPQGAEALAALAHLDNLTVLDLGENPIGDAGAWALTESPHLGRLRFLNLVNTNITSGDIFASEHCLPAIEEIRLGNNPISATAREKLRARFGHRVIFDG